MDRQIVNTGKPAEAKNAHSAGIIASGSFFFTSGITPRDAMGNVGGVGDITEQICQTWFNLREVLLAAGTDFEHVVKYTVFVTDISAYFVGRKDQRVRKNMAMIGKPASTVVEVSKFSSPDIMIEIEAVAMVPKK